MTEKRDLMVLEALVSPLSAEKKPWNLFLIGFLYSILAIFISYWIFPEYAGIVSITLIVIAFLPLLYATMKTEEERDISSSDELKLLAGHSRALSFFVFLFMGITIAVAVLYIFLPSNVVSAIFQPQINTISRIQTSATYTGGAVSSGMFSKIFLNNMKVLGFCIVFSLLYGAGAIFILSWNASVIGAAIGEFARQEISKYAGLLGLMNISSYFSAFGLGLVRYMIHGIPEVAAYFVGALAGGIISVAVIRHEIGTKKFEKVIADASILVLISVAMLMFAAALEVYVIPLLF